MSTEIADILRIAKLENAAIKAFCATHPTMNLKKFEIGLHAFRIPVETRFLTPTLLAHDDWDSTHGDNDVIHFISQWYKSKRFHGDQFDWDDFTKDDFDAFKQCGPPPPPVAAPPHANPGLTTPIHTQADIQGAVAIVPPGTTVPGSGTGSGLIPPVLAAPGLTGQVQEDTLSVVPHCGTVTDATLGPPTTPVAIPGIPVQVQDDIPGPTTTPFDGTSTYLGDTDSDWPADIFPGRSISGITFKPPGIPVLVQGTSPDIVPMENQMASNIPTSADSIDTIEPFPDTVINIVLAPEIPPEPPDDYYCVLTAIDALDLADIDLEDDLTKMRRAFTASVVPMSLLTSDAVHSEAYWTCIITPDGGATSTLQNVSDLANDYAGDVSELADDDLGTSSACVNIVIDVKDLAGDTAPGLSTHDYFLAAESPARNARENGNLADDDPTCLRHVFTAIDAPDIADINLEDEHTKMRRAFTASVVPMSLLTSDAAHSEAYWTCNTTRDGGATSTTHVSDLANDYTVNVSELADDDPGATSTLTNVSDLAHDYALDVSELADDDPGATSTLTNVSDLANDDAVDASELANDDPGTSTACVNLVIDVKDLADTAPGLPTHDYFLAAESAARIARENGYVADDGPTCLLHVLTAIDAPDLANIDLEDELTKMRRVFTASVLPMFIITSDAVHSEAYWSCTTTPDGGATSCTLKTVSDLANDSAVDVSELANNDPGTSTAYVNLVIDVKGFADTDPGLPTHDYALADDNLISARADNEPNLILRDYYALTSSLADVRAACTAREYSDLAVLHDEELASTLRDYYHLSTSLTRIAREDSGLAVLRDVDHASTLQDYYDLTTSVACIAREDSGLAVLRDADHASTLRDYYDLTTSLARIAREDSGLAVLSAVDHSSTLRDNYDLTNSLANYRAARIAREDSVLAVLRAAHCRCANLLSTKLAMLIALYCATIAGANLVIFWSAADTDDKFPADFARVTSNADTSTNIDVQKLTHDHGIYLVPSTMCYPHDDLMHQIPSVYYFGGPYYKKSTVQNQALPVPLTTVCYSGTMRALFAEWLLDTLASDDFWHLFPQVQNNSLTMGGCDTLLRKPVTLASVILLSMIWLSGTLSLLRKSLLVLTPSRQPLRTFDSSRGSLTDTVFFFLP
jgi:hypothetical protein